MTAGRAMRPDVRRAPAHGRRFPRLCVAFLLLVTAPGVFADIVIESQSLKLHFGRLGDLERVEACFPTCTDPHAQTQVMSSRLGMLLLAPRGSGASQTARRREKDATVLEFSSDGGKLLRRWRIPDRGWLISLQVTGMQRAELATGEGFRPRSASGLGYLLEQTRYLFFEEGRVQAGGLDETGLEPRETGDWFGFRNRFWAAMIRPGRVYSVAPVTGDRVQDAALLVDFPAGKEAGLELYLGPVEPVALRQTAPELEKLMYSGLWFWLRWICQGLYALLGAIHALLPDWALAVMVMSVLVSLLMRPLSGFAERLQDQVHATDARLRPALARIKKDYRGAKQSEEILALYKTEGVHPLYSLKSLAGVAVVIPVFIGAFDMLAENIHLAGASFLWITDLSRPDAFAQLPFALPFFGRDLNLLPFIMTGFSFAASKLHSPPSMDAAQQRRQARNLVLMSLGFFLLFYTFPAGMVLYWTSNNLISVARFAWRRRRNRADAA